jgi:hypothetical protein
VAKGGNRVAVYSKAAVYSNARLGIVESLLAVCSCGCCGYGCIQRVWDMVHLWRPACLHVHATGLVQENCKKIRKLSRSLLQMDKRTKQISSLLQFSSLLQLILCTRYWLMLTVPSSTTIPTMQLCAVASPCISLLCPALLLHKLPPVLHPCSDSLQYQQALPPAAPAVVECTPVLFAYAFCCFCLFTLLLHSFSASLHHQQAVPAHTAAPAHTAHTTHRLSPVC